MTHRVVVSLVRDDDVISANQEFGKRRNGGRTRSSARWIAIHWLALLMFCFSSDTATICGAQTTSNKLNGVNTPGTKFPSPKSPRPQFLKPTTVTIIVDSICRRSGEAVRSLMDSSHEHAIGLRVSARLTEPIGEAYARVGWYPHSNHFLNR